jgi:hypothetical protein
VSFLQKEREEIGETLGHELRRRRTCAGSRRRWGRKGAEGMTRRREEVVEIVGNGTLLQLRRK